MPETKVPLRERRKLVRSFRKQTGLTLKALGELAGLSFAMIAKFENGTRDLSEASWTRLREAMDNFAHTATENYKERIDAAKETVARLSPEAVERIRENANRILAGDFPIKESEELDSYIAERFARILGCDVSHIESLWKDPNGGAELDRLAAEKLESIPFAERSLLHQYAAAKALLDRQLRWIESIERAQSQVNDPVLSEIIQSFRSEIAELEKQNAELKSQIRAIDTED
jgi:transcriptional regulator with XRE-family HTH domain